MGESLAGDRLVPPPLDRTFDPQSVDRVARDNALEPIGVRPKLTSYVRELWERRSFIKVLAVSKAYAENQNTYLGQLWTLFSPIMNASVAVVMFGSLSRIGCEGLSTTVWCIVCGVFMFRLFERWVSAGAS